MGSNTAKGMSEVEAIRALNRAKGFSPHSVGADAAAEEESSKEKSVKINTVVGFDSASESEPPATPPASPPAQSVPVVPAITLEDNGTITVTHKQLYLMAETKARADTAKFQQEIDKLKATLEARQRQLDEEADKFAKEKSELEEKIEKEKRQRDGIAKVFTDFGFNPDGSAPTSSLPDSIDLAPSQIRVGLSPKDAVRGLERLYQDAHATQVVNADTGSIAQQRDLRKFERHILEYRDTLRKGMEALARDAGLLQGQVSGWKGKDAPTTFANFPVLLREYLSSVVRIEHSARFVLWQFVNRNIATGVPPEQTTLVPRVRHLEIGATSSAWLLTPGVRTTADRQNLAGNNISVLIREWGMGYDAGAGNPTVRPVAIADIVMQTNLLDLETLLRDRIGYNYHTWEDLLIFELLLSTTRIVYCSGDGVVDAPGDVTVGGQITSNFLGNLRSAMSSAHVPPLEDGCYIYVGPPDHIAQLESDLQVHHSYADMSGVESLTNMLVAKTRNEYMGRQNGYRGRIRGFHVYEATSFSIGAPGTPGVQTETVAGTTVTSVTTRSGFAIGVDAIGMAVSLPMELREDNNDDFGRIRSLIWKTHAGATGLDIDPDRTLLSYEPARPTGAEEQLRVFEVRASTVAVK